MFDSYIRPVIDPPLNRIACVLASWGVRANVMTAAGFGLSLCTFAALAMQAYGPAALFIVLSRLADGLDGPLARQSKATDLGGYIDIVSDFIFYSGTVFFFAVGKPDMALPAAFLIFSFMGTGSSFLAYAIVTAKRGINDERTGQKSFFYLDGITEGSEAIFTLLLFCLLPSCFAWIAGVYGILCWITTWGRVRTALRTFR